MAFSEIELIKSLAGLEGYDLNDNELTELLISDDDNFIQRFHLGFMFMVENINEQLSTTYLRVINDIISENKLFYYSKDLDLEFSVLDEITDPEVKAAKLLTYLFNHKYFGDCNEVTAVLFTSAMLIQSRVGVIRIPVNLKNTFYELMNEDEELFVKFISSFCIDRSLFSC